ncbi:hypothetical protein JMUB590_0276 [Staphylococcus caprae]|uniref:Uncharacterized protein n=1 Tax=Staphylococcus caprae TaxID=29380 RepID=A0ABM7FRX9_9STAP|nr:hypothetical protein JMUB145_0291 [Staphylococcus caprae]BBD91386.1 hypothetical protein JMUB590_0276 [Staphylococcus caprae]BBD93889.1 hypothetical protein JMUB898_0269 [Staphylococcus caprae]
MEAIIFFVFVFMGITSLSKNAGMSHGLIDYTPYSDGVQLIYIYKRECFFSYLKIFEENSYHNSLIVSNLV